MCSHLAHPSHVHRLQLLFEKRGAGVLGAVEPETAHEHEHEHEAAARNTAVDAGEKQRAAVARAALEGGGEVVGLEGSLPARVEERVGAAVRLLVKKWRMTPTWSCNVR